MAEKNFFLEMTAPVTMDDVWRSEKRKKQTNADRIRAMTDEELCDAACEHGYCPTEEIAETRRNCYEYGCKRCWLDWLKQEASDGGAD